MATVQTDLVPKGWSYSYLLRRGGTTIATLDKSTWGRTATLSIVGGMNYQLQARGVLQRTFTMTQGDSLIASARNEGFFSCAMIVSHPAPYVLKSESTFQRAFLLLASGQRVGSVAPLGWFTRKATAEMPAELPLELQGFFIWLVLTTWQRNQSGATVAVSS